jgi:hypothetical protein
MSFVRLLRTSTALVFLTTATTASVLVAGCGDGKEAKVAKVASGPMPEGETWTGVYFHPTYGYLHMQEEGSNVVGRWKWANQSKWGELSGTTVGNVLHYTWREHTIGLVGAAATTHGKGYFQYKMDKENRPVLDGQYGLNNDETGIDWHSVKQARMPVDIKSIGGDSEGIKPGGF